MNEKALLQGRFHKWRTVALAALLIAAIVFLSACGGAKLSGTYSSADMVAQTFTFRGDTVVMSAFGVNAAGTYRIEGDMIEIRYSLFGAEYTWRQPFSRSRGDIWIGGTRFIRQ